MLHSLQDWTRSELEPGEVHVKVKEEKKRREHVLDIRQALAKEVTQKTREVAGES